MLETSIFTTDDYDKSFERDTNIDEAIEKAKTLAAAGIEAGTTFIKDLNKPDAGNNK